MKLGKTNIEISKQGLGCMSMSEFYGTPLPEEEAIALIQEAYKKGINFFDTADMYGLGENEKLVGKAVHQLILKGIKRNSFVIATKCGIVRDKNDATTRGIDNSYAYVKSSCEESLKRLGQAVKIIDLYYIHRIANNGEQIEEAMHAMADLLHEQKILAVGLSEASVDVIEKANQALLHYTNGLHQIAAVQSEYSLLTRRIEENGVLKKCQKLGITLVSYSPLSRALLTGEITTPEQFEKDDARRLFPRFQNENLIFNNAIVQNIKILAEQKQCSTAQIALAWLMGQSNVVPIPGTTKIHNLLSNIDAMSVQLSEADYQLLNKLAQPKGERYTESYMKAFQFDD